VQTDALHFIFANKKNMEKEQYLFEVFYHPNEYTHLFLSAFDSLEQAESIIKKSHPDFSKVLKSETKHPYISINFPKYSDEAMLQLFFCRINKLTAAVIGLATLPQFLYFL
jgi:hypothetical protein